VNPMATDNPPTASFKSNSHDDVLNVKQASTFSNYQRYTFIKRGLTTLKGGGLV